MGWYPWPWPFRLKEEEVGGEGGGVIAGEGGGRRLMKKMSANLDWDNGQFIYFYTMCDL